MKVMIDTNIIISAILFPNGRTAQALLKALMLPYEPLLCDYVVRRITQEIPRKISTAFVRVRRIFILYISICSASSSTDGGD